MGKATDRPITTPTGALTRAERLHLAHELRALLEGFRRAIVHGDREAARAAARVGGTEAAMAAAIARSWAALDEARAMLADGERVLAVLEGGTEG